MAVLGGLNLFPVSRLKKTWEVSNTRVMNYSLFDRFQSQGLPEKYKDLFKELETLMDNKQNYHKYRDALLLPPSEGLGTVPYLGNPFVAVLH